MTPRSTLARALFLLGVAALALLAFWFTVQRVRAGMIGWLNDDAMYASYAKALLDGRGYVDTAYDPPIVAQRYPIGFPALLALASWGASSVAEMVPRMQLVGPLSVMAFVGLSAWYFRRHGWPAWGAFLGAGLIAIQPDISIFGSMVLSDVPAAVLGLATLMLFERCFRDEARPRRWLLAGLLLGVCGLLRYALAPVGLAVAILLLKQRRVKESLATGAGVLLALGPWLLFRLLAGGDGYGAPASGLLGLDPALLSKNFSLSAAYMLTSGLPAFIGPHLLGGWSLAGALTGAAMAAVTLLGALAWLLRPREGQSALGALVLILTVAMIMVWEIRFITLGAGLVVRLMIPVAPLLLVAFVRGGAEIYERVARPRFAPALAGGLALAVVANGLYVETWRAMHPDWRDWQSAEQASVASALTFVSQQLPAEAKLASFKSSLVHFHTGRRCASLSIERTNDQLLWWLHHLGSEYVVGLPLYMELGGDGPQFVDASAVILNDMAKAHPGLFLPVHLSHDRTSIVLKVDRAILAKAVAALQAANSRP